MRYLVTDGYRMINKPNAIIITNVFMQASIQVTREQWLSVIGSCPPSARNDVQISQSEINQLSKLSRN